MTRQAMKLDRRTAKTHCLAPRRRCASPPLSAVARGLTLIELLVTIVIMVGVLGAVIPLMSPNNNSRKIREASRQLNSLIQQAHAQAARDGRPAGVAFREFNTSGIALEAFAIAEPPPFAGFSADSRVVCTPVVAAPTVYGSSGNGGRLFIKQFDGRQLFQLTFILGNNPANLDLLPPGMFRFGDVIEVDHREFMIVDDEKDGDAPNVVEVVDGAKVLEATTEVQCVWINQSPQDLGPQGAERYSIRRVPASTTDQPLVFPRGIGIDLQGSHATGPDGPDDFDSGGPTTIKIMFEPNGSLQGLYFDDRPLTRIDQVFMLLGLFENGYDGSDPDWELRYDFVVNRITPGDRDALTQRRRQINWLHPDAQWVAVNRAGRIVVAENNVSFDPSQSPFIDGLTGTPEEQRSEQRQRQLIGFNLGGNSYPGARLYAQQMQQEGGR
jgi:type II secretory pathway pseudopilin PulG